MRHRGMGILLLVAGLLVAVIGQADAQVQTLRFLWFTDGPDRPAIEGLVKRLNVTNPDVKIEFSIVPFAELNQLLVTQASAGQAPDLASFRGELVTDWHYVLAMTVLSIVPIAPVFAVLQRYLVSGIATTGLKG